jgi:serine/threonine-protein kinase SRPK3
MAEADSSESSAVSYTLQIYRYPFLDDIEEVERYRPGGFHPVDLDDVLNDKYKIVHKLGHGGSATIWLARILSEERHVAIKILAAAKHPTQELKFPTHLREHGANHPNIASLQETFMVEGPNGRHQCLVFKSAGPSLMRLAVSKHQFSEGMARIAAQQLAEGVAFLHSLGIGHGVQQFPFRVQLLVSNVS